MTKKILGANDMKKDITMLLTLIEMPVVAPDSLLLIPLQQAISRFFTTSKMRLSIPFYTIHLYFNYRK